jgi:CRISPR/Cas system CMR subunit Cmr4 (Cas7 group RAMP superfamily)
MPNTRIYWLHTLSPTHAGIGRGVGYIDLPIDRDGVTGWPIIRGSSFKGVWADHHRATPDARKDNPTLRAAFGVAGDDNNSNAGALIPTDARLVCLPVRSFRGTFAWATSSLCLQMLKRTLALAGVENLPDAPVVPEEGKAHHTAVTALVEGGPSTSKISTLRHRNATSRRPGRGGLRSTFSPANPAGKNSSRNGSSSCRTRHSTFSAKPAPRCIRESELTTN